MVKNKTYSKEFKTKVSLEAIKEDKTVNEIAGIYQINPSQVKRWKKRAIEGIKGSFGSDKGQREDQENLVNELYREIGQLKYENDWVKKKLGILV